MNIKPILFNTDMVRAIQNGTKTVTRRVVKPQHLRVLDSPYRKEHPETPDKALLERLCEPPYRPSDILYVRETWCKTDCFGLQDGYAYKANDNSILEHTGFTLKWKPSIHMPREAARIFLRVTDVRVERLQDISDNDLVRDFAFCPEAIKVVGRDALARPFWNSTINSSDLSIFGWDANPWVWVTEFERISREEAVS